MPLDNKELTLKRLGAFAGMLDDCSAIVVCHVSEAGNFTFHRGGNVYTQLGALAVLEKGMRNGLVETDWNPDAEEEEEA